MEARSGATKAPAAFSIDMSGSGAVYKVYLGRVHDHGTTVML
jgi:hypothetical protein